MANDEAFSMRQTVKHTVMALRKFFEAQLSIKADEVRRKLARKEGTLPPAPTPAYKVGGGFYCSNSMCQFLQRTLQKCWCVWYYRMDIEEHK